MTTKLISFKEYRANLSKIWKKSQEENVKYIVLVHSKPAFEVTPIQPEEDFDLDFRELKEHEITDEMRKAVEESRKKPLSDFVNITEKYADHF